MYKDIVITDLSAGYNDSDPPTSLADNQCVTAENIDFWDAPCGARRTGMSAITMPAAFASTSYIHWVHRHFPNNDETDTEFWAASSDFAPSNVVAMAYKDTSWHAVTVNDTPTIAAPELFQWSSVSLHGKLFISYPSAIDRIFVWDGTSLRRVGLLEPSAAPTSADTGVGGTFTTTRYYRTRETVQVSSVTILRSEPSAVLTDAPVGTNTGIIVTKPSTTNSNATHWELEASLNNVDFYRIATTVIGTSTATDTQSAAVGYAASFTLSEDAGDYEVPTSARYLLAADDRLFMGGSFMDESKASMIRWTPVGTEPDAVGNDERIPIDTDNSLNLDGYEGGRLTGMVGPINGVIYAFKSSHIYRLIKTGQRSRAYEAYAVSKTRGAIEGSITVAEDEQGNPAVYFIDPKVGPCRLGQGGLKTCGEDISGTFDRVNLGASLIQGGLVARVLYHPKKKKIYWWLALDFNAIPNVILILQINSQRQVNDGIRYGWAKWTGDITTVASICLYAENLEGSTPRSVNLVPVMGSTYIVGGSNEAGIYIFDDSDDDAGEVYTATLTSRPFQVSGSINKNFGIRAASIIGDADADAEVQISLIRDFGAETSSAVDLSLAPTGSEDPVLAVADNLKMSEARVVQVKLTDGTDNDSQWAIQRIDLIPREEQGR